jgi:hypothetical protein
MNDTATKPNFAAWELGTLASLCSDLWDDNLKLREANEQLRSTNKDLSALLRKQFMQEDDMK